MAFVDGFSELYQMTHGAKWNLSLPNHTRTARLESSAVSSSSSVLCNKHLFIDLKCSQVSCSLLLLCLIKTTSSPHRTDNYLLNQSNKKFTVLFLTFSALIFLSNTSVFFPPSAHVEKCWKIPRFSPKLLEFILRGTSILNLWPANGAKWNIRRMF